MQIKQSVPKRMKYLMKLLILLLFLFPLISLGQTTYIPLGSEEYIFLDRLEIKAQKDSVLVFSKTKPYSREIIIQRMTDSSLNSIIERSRVDQYNYRRLLINNVEWVTNGDSALRSRKPWGK